MADLTTPEVTSPIDVLRASQMEKYEKSMDHICIKHCLHEGVDEGKYVKCFLCGHKYHFTCMEIGATEAKPLWNCYTCRFVSHDLTMLRQSINKLFDIVSSQQVKIEQLTTGQTSDTETLTQIKTDLNSFTTEAKPELKSLRDDFNVLSEHIAPEHCDTDSDSDMSSDSEDDDEPDGHLLVGDSLIRHVEPTKEGLDAGFEVRHFGGAKFCDIKKKLQSFKNMKYQDVTVVCGTNDSSTKKPLDKIKDECQSLLSVAKTKAVNVHICSILPRTDERVDSDRINSLNTDIKDLAISEEVHFIDNDNNFKYQDGTTDVSLLSADGLHLSDLGVKRLLRNVSLEDVAESGLSRPNTTTPTPNKPNTPSGSTGYHSFMQGGGDRQTSRPSFYKFRGQHEVYSNFYSAWIQMNNMWYPTNEHAYQHRKAVVMKDWQRADDILRAETPQDAKYYGKLINTDDYWHSIKSQVMHEILHEKVKQCTEFSNALRNSMGQELIESTTNEYWAEGANGRGRNMLGKLLMLVRQECFGPRGHGPKSFATKSSQPRCFNCSETGHVTQSCGFQAPIVCRKCSLLGHKVKSCPY